MMPTAGSRVGHGRQQVNANRRVITLVKCAANISIPNNAWTTVAFDTIERNDPQVQIASNQIKVCSDYLQARFTLGLNWQNVLSLGSCGGRIDVNGSSTVFIEVKKDVAESNARKRSRWLSFNQGDLITWLVFQNRGAARNLSGTGFGGNSYLQIEWR